MFNFNNTKKQIGSLLLLSVVLTGVTAAPSYAHKAKTDRANVSQVAEGEKIALMEGNVSVRELPSATVEEVPATKAPLSLQQVGKYNFDFGGGSFGAAGI